MKQINNYNGVAITFAKKDDSKNVFVNATEMAKPFEKRPNDWLNLPSTKDFLSELSDTRKSCNVDYQAVITIKGGLDLTKQGTWLHEDAAIEYARWLSPKFAIWCNDRIKELLTSGVTTINNDDETILNAINILQKRLEESKVKQKELEQKVEEQKPKVLFADTVSSSKTSILVGELAKLIAQKGVNIGQNRLFEWLRQNHYTCKKNGNKNYPTQKSIDLGILEVVERTLTNSNGSALTTFTTKVTGKGQIYFVNKLSKQSIN